MPHCLTVKDTYGMIVKGQKSVFISKLKLKIAGIAILIFDQVDFKAKLVRRGKENDYILMKGIICQDDKAIITICFKY